MKQAISDYENGWISPYDLIKTYEHFLDNIHSGNMFRNKVSEALMPMASFVIDLFNDENNFVNDIDEFDVDRYNGTMELQKKISRLEREKMELETENAILSLELAECKQHLSDLSDAVADEEI